MGYAKLKERPANQEQCSIKGCDNPAVYNRSRLCHACYQSLRYHIKLGPAHVAKWAQRVEKFAARAGVALGSRETRKLRRVK